MHIDGAQELPLCIICMSESIIKVKYLLYFPGDETQNDPRDVLDAHIGVMIKECAKPSCNWNFAVLKDLMDATLNIRRTWIENYPSPSVEEIQGKYPALFSVTEVFYVLYKY